MAYPRYSLGGARIKQEYDDDYDNYHGVPPITPYRSSNHNLFEASTNFSLNSTRVLKNKFMSIHAPTAKSSVIPSSHCFHTTVSIHGPTGGDRPVVIQSVLLDSGAGDNFLHRDVVNLVNLPTHRLTEGKQFEGAWGHTAVHDEMVHFQLYLGGVGNNVWAFVDDSNVRSRMVIGEPAWETFRINRKTIGTGSTRHAQVTVSPDVTGFRMKNYVVPPDPVNIRPRAYVPQRDDEMVRQLESPMSIPQLREHQRQRRQRITERAREAKKGVRSWLYDDGEW